MDSKRTIKSVHTCFPKNISKYKRTLKDPLIKWNKCNKTIHKVKGQWPESNSNRTLTSESSSEYSYRVSMHILTLVMINYNCLKTSSIWSLISSTAINKDIHPKLMTMIFIMQDKAKSFIPLSMVNSRGLHLVEH